MNPKEIEHFFQIGKIYEQINCIFDAKKYYEKAINLSTENNEINNSYGRILLKFSELEKGLKYIGKSTGFVRFTEKDIKIIS